MIYTIKIHSQKCNLITIFNYVGLEVYGKSFGVGLGPIFPGKPDLDHQTNEYIEIDDLILNAKIYSHAIYELAK